MSAPPAPPPANPSSRRPNVSGISPKEGTPGTQLTIRGENLGQSQKDLIGLVICGTDCLVSARWQSSHKIIARVGQAKGGPGDIVVNTRSGGRGTCTVKFRVFTVQIGPLQESAVWVDESRTVPGRQPAGAAAAPLIDDDPLGISDERDEKRIADNKIAELFPNGTGNIRLENFVPARYLLENHQTAALNDLKTGLAYMQRQASTLKEGPRDLLKANLHSFINCVDSLSALNSKLNELKVKNGWPLTEKLEHTVDKSSKMADRLFTEVLGRKDRADATRNALQVLTRFKFVFFLPHNIDVNLEKGDYAAVLNDYTRVRSLFGETDVPLFKEALSEIEIKMTNFKRILNDRLLEMPSTLDEQKKIIRYLLILEPNANPGWGCLSAHHLWLQGLLWNAQERFWKIARDEQKRVDSDYEGEERRAAEMPQRFDLADHILSTLTTKLQHFWKLVQAYINGQLSAGPNLHKEEEAEQMLIDTINLSSWIVLNALLPDSTPPAVKERYGERFVSWPQTRTSDQVLHLLQALRKIRLCIATLQQQEFSNKQVQPLAELSVTLRLKCLASIIDRAVATVGGLEQKENWKVQTHEHDYTKTLLPDLFETQVTEILPLVRQILSCNHFTGETDLFAKERFRTIIVQSFEDLINSFKDVLERLVKLGPAQLSNGPSRPSSLALGQTKETWTTVKDKKLLIALSNCDYALRFSLVTICERFKANEVQRTDKIMQRCVTEYASLRSNLLKAYIQVKCAPFSDLIFPVKYESIDEVLGVNNYIKDLLLCIASVQAELFLVAPHFTQQVMSFVLRSCSEQLAEHLRTLDNKQLDAVAATQAVTDASAFEEATRSYLASDTRRLLLTARTQLLRSADQEVVQRCLREFRHKMRLTLHSLQHSLADGETADV